MIVIAPSLTQTEMTEEGDPAYAEEFARARCFQRKQFPEDLTGALLFLASEHSDFITGQILNVDGGVNFHWKIEIGDLRAGESDSPSLEGGGHLGDKAVELLEAPGWQ